MDALLNEVVGNPILVATEPIPILVATEPITILVAPKPIPDPTIKVLNTPLKKTIQVLGFRVSVISVQLGHSARLAVNLNCLHGESPFIDYKEIVIEGEEYSNWGNDDAYILELVSSKILSLL